MSNKQKRGRPPTKNPLVKQSLSFRPDQIEYLKGLKNPENLSDAARECVDFHAEKAACAQARKEKS